VVAAHLVRPVGGSNPYYEIYSDVFQATATDLELSFIKSNPQGGDTTALVDNVAILAIAPGTPPQILTQPVGQTATTGDTITFTAAALGSPPLSYQWEKNGVAILGQITASLTLTNVTATDSGFYSILVSNSAGSTNSSAAALNVNYQLISGILFGTGVAANGALLEAPAIDPHYILTTSADANFPGPNAIAVSNVWPIAAGVWALNGPNSVWIGPQADQSIATGGNASGDYVYQTSFNLTGQDLSKIFITGGWATDNVGTGILINGVNSGIVNTVQFPSLTPFILTATNGLVAGPNTLDFLVNNAAGTPDVPGPTGLRVDLKLLSIITPKLQLSRSGTKITIVWWPIYTGQQLKSAPTPNGPWTAITGAASPYTATLGATNTFYRVTQ
jgi:Immunoglobulin domain